jgi:hypothetical protein
MAQIRNGMDGGTKEEICMRVEEAGLNFEKAKDLAKHIGI